VEFHGTVIIPVMYKQAFNRSHLSNYEYFGRYTAVDIVMGSKLSAAIPSVGPNELVPGPKMIKLSQL